MLDLLPDQTKGLIAYINLRLALGEAATQRGIDATGASPAEAADWSWVKDQKQQHRATRELVKKIEAIGDVQLRQSLLMSVAAAWLEHPPLVDRRDLPYTSNGGGLTYLTPCCLATPTYSGGELCCRSCYMAYDTVLAAQPEPAPTDVRWDSDPGQPPVGAGYCPPCKEWDAHPDVHSCPTCGKPWAVRVTEAGAQA